MATTQAPDGQSGETRQTGGGEALWDAGAAVVRDLAALRDAYDGYIRTAEDVSGTAFSEAEARDYKTRAIEHIADLTGTGDGPEMEAFHARLDAAYRAAVSFSDADPAERRRYRARAPDAYDALVRAAPSPIHADHEPLMQEFRPGQGAFYRLTAGVIERGGTVLDDWNDANEQIYRDAAANADPATTPDDRVDAAERMFQ